MKQYTAIQVGKRTHVLCDAETRWHTWPDANYMATNKALCGVLRKGQSLKQWIEEKNKRNYGRN